MTNFNKEQTIIMNLVSRFGCVSMQQIYDLIPEQNHKSLQMLVTQLVKGKYLEIVNEQYMVMYGCKSNYKKKVIDSLWAIIRLSNGSLDDILDVLNGASPVDYVLTVNHSKTYRILTPNEARLAVLHDYIEESYKKAQKKKKEKKEKYHFESFYTLVVTSKEIMSLIKEYDFPVPIYVVYMNYISPYKPQIRCLKKSPKVASESE